MSFRNILSFKNVKQCVCFIYQFTLKNAAYLCGNYSFIRDDGIKMVIDLILNGLFHLPSQPDQASLF